MIVPDSSSWWASMMATWSQGASSCTFTGSYLVLISAASSRAAWIAAGVTLMREDSLLIVASRSGASSGTSETSKVRTLSTSGLP